MSEISRDPLKTEEAPKVVVIELQRIVGDPSSRLYQSAGELIRSIEQGG